MYIYILKLKSNKWYVGKMNNPNVGYYDYLNSCGSYWIEKYKPIKIDRIIKNCDDYDEDKYTIMYMKKYGIENVRGGSFCELKLKSEYITTIKHMIKSTNDKCYLCGKEGHFCDECLIQINDYESSDIDIDGDFENLCYRCGRIGHFVKDCYAKYDVNGNNLC